MEDCAPLLVISGIAEFRCPRDERKMVSKSLSKSTRLRIAWLVRVRRVLQAQLIRIGRGSAWLCASCVGTGIWLEGLAPQPDSSQPAFNTVEEDREDREEQPWTGRSGILL